MLEFSRLRIENILHFFKFLHFPVWYFTEFCKKENYSQFIFCLPFHYILDHPAYFKRNWNFQQLRSIPGYPAFLTSRNRFVSLPFFFFRFFPEIIVHLDEPDHFACTKPYKPSKRLFSLFFSARFYRQIGVRLWRTETFQAYTYVATFPMIVNPISSWFIGSTSEWTWKLTCVLLIDLSHIFYLKIIIDKYRQIKDTIRLKFPFLFFYG